MSEMYGYAGKILRVNLKHNDFDEILQYMAKVYRINRPAIDSRPVIFAADL